MCPACAETYRWDAYHLIAAGLRGGKGVPDSVTAHPATFLTLTPPSFGTVHTRLDRTGRPGAGRSRLGPCRPRRDRPACPHGRPMSCGVVHGDGDKRTGTPLCLDCYDHAAQVAWNAFVPKLWTRTIDAVKRELRRLSRAHGGTAARIRYAKVAEFQARGAVHLHALVRLDGADPNDPDAVVAPPSWATAELLNGLLVDAARSTAIRTPPHPDMPDGWVVQWGEQVRPLSVARGLPGAEVTEQHVAGYLAKYATKATEPAGHLSARLTASTVRIYTDPAKHTGRLVSAAWELGRPEAGDGWSRLRPWAHMLGFGGHFATKSRTYSTSFGALRAARSTAMRRANATAAHAEQASDEETETVLVVGSWTYAGTGWRTTADAALALAAADAARQRRPAAADPAA
ncbi:MAG TPA: replication initiator [Mycobacteriales bacterium]|nr:replication initiator [Mycobacteriales bacterium]